MEFEGVYGLACAKCLLVEWLPGKKLEQLEGVVDAHTDATGGEHMFYPSLARAKGASIVADDGSCDPVLKRLNIKEGKLVGLEKFRS